MPQDPILLLVRRRSDIADLYRLVNADGLWARTLNAPLDNHIQMKEGVCEEEPDQYEQLQTQFLGDVQSLEELINSLR